MSDTALLQRVALDAYPQRDDEKAGWLERAGEKIFCAPFEIFATGKLRLRMMLPAPVSAIASLKVAAKLPATGRAVCT